MEKGKIYLSVILPAYNEERRIGKTLSEIIAFLKRQSYASEIIVSDDGSADATVNVSEKQLSGFPHEILRAPENRGKGSAVRAGMMRGRGKYLLFSDADLSTPIEEVTEFIRRLENGYDVVLGSRALKESKIEIRQPPMRELMGKTFNKIARLFAFRGIRDSQCGFKLFKQEAARDLFGRQKLNGFSFDAEIIFLAQKLGYRILEAPVRWRNSKLTRVRLLSDSLQMFKEVVGIRWIHRGL